MTWGMGAALILCILVAITWIVLCYRKIIPDPFAKWSLFIAGALFTVGIMPLMQWLARQGEKDAESLKPIPDYKPVGPTPDETKALDDRVEETNKKLEEIKANDEILEDTVHSNPGTVNPELGGPFAERLRKLREGSSGDPKPGSST